MKIRFHKLKEVSEQDIRLCQAAERIAALLERLKVGDSTRGIMACLDDAFGATYSLLFALFYDFQGRSTALNDAYYKDVRVRARDMSEGHVRTEGKWAAGFYFNSALLRIDAVYMRALATIGGDDGVRTTILLKRVKKWFRDTTGENWSDTAIEKLNCEVNKLKHRPSAITAKREALVSDPAQAIAEKLTLLDAFEKAGCPSPPQQSVACVSNLGSSGGSDVRGNKDAMIAEASEGLR